MANLTFKVDDSGARSRLARLDSAVSSPRGAFETVGRVLVSRIKLCFKLGIDPWGTPWAALKIRKGQPLRDTGRLNRSITSSADNGGVTVGTNVQYARTHQYGANIQSVKAKRLVFQGPGGRLIFAKRVTIPARPFMPLRRGSAVAELPPGWSADVTRALRAYFIAAADKAAA